MKLHRRFLATLSAAALVSLALPAGANGRNQGSLLIFPEYDTQAGRDTLLTLTNTATSGGTLLVRLYFVKGTGTEGTGLCTRTGFDIPLTPGDTYSALASAHVANERGYAYAFAINGQGAAVAFNGLIGDEIVTDGLFALDYAVNPISFESRRPQGQLTDLDGDQERDLDGEEYEAAPDTVLIPRFMGQSGTFHSELVLIHLSGGAPFTAIADFLAFNDNEEALSAQYSFRCWTKVPLSTISGVFARDFLANFTNDSSQEIIGSNTNEAGWLRIDGNLAQSTQTVISNPVILAMLVEGASGPHSGAELPFFHGTNTNGILLPAGATGDIDN